ncbi:hypothetical protein Bca52824_053907 [Brassica carinata]|uniref:Uncharacterized protein n=1 Tax=Brassica carinata TaxID=52824 RepID=A0A8X7R7F2_BRACI|nr:hypothetical protein Bca52824_053907 [Brassica carinata]
MSTTTLFQSSSHDALRRINDQGIIAACHYGAEYETEYSHRSNLTLQHRSTIPTKYRPTYQGKNRLTVAQKIGRTTTTSLLWQHTPDTTCIRRSMMKIMRRNELHSTGQFLMRKTNFYIIPPGGGTHHRSTTSSPSIDGSQPKSINIRDTPIDQQQETAADRQPPAHRSTSTSHIPSADAKIDIARLNALRPKPKPSDNPPRQSIPSDDAAGPMEVDMRNKETEEDITRMFVKLEKMSKRVTLNKKSDLGNLQYHVEPSRNYSPSWIVLEELRGIVRPRGADW